MHLLRSPLRCLACLTLLGLAPGLRAESPTDALQLVPAQVDFVAKIERPRQFVETVTNFDLFQQLYDFAPVREFYDAGVFRRLFQILAYFERELGLSRYEMLDRLACGGAVLSVKFGEPNRFLFIFQGKDEALLQKFKALALKVAEPELARLEVKEPLKKAIYRGVEAVQFTKELLAATHGTTLLVSNNGKALTAGIDQCIERTSSILDSSAFQEARRLLPPDPAVSAYLNLDNIRQAKQIQELLAMPNDNPVLPFLFGGYLDLARRAPFITAGLYTRPDGLHLTVRLPRGREGRADIVSAHVPPVGQPGSRPLLQPKHVLFSTSYYFDLAKVWEHRHKLLNEQVASFLEGIDKGAANFPGGAPLSKILGMLGPYQRIVVAAQDKPGYQVEPAQRFPALALVFEMRDVKGFRPLIDLGVRAAALQLTAQFRMKSFEEKIGEWTLSGYRFPEDGKLPGDVNNLRFNISPCFAFVGNQFLICSTAELGREMVQLLDTESKGTATGSPASGQTQVFGAGGVVALKALEEQLLAQAVLGQALSPEAAKQHVQTLLDSVRRAGALRLEAIYGEKEFRYDFELKFGK